MEKKKAACWWPCVLEPRRPNAKGGEDDVMLLDLGRYHQRKRNSQGVDSAMMFSSHRCFMGAVIKDWLVVRCGRAATKCFMCLTGTKIIVMNLKFDGQPYIREYQFSFFFFLEMFSKK